MVTLTLLLLLATTMEALEPGPVYNLGDILGNIFQIFKSEPDKKVLKDFPHCGELGEKEINAPRSNLDSGCFKRCDWVPNPFYKSKLPEWPLYTKDNSKGCYTLTEYVDIFLTAPKIPTNIDCLRPCFMDGEKYVASVDLLPIRGKKMLKKQKYSRKRPGKNGGQICNNQYRDPDVNLEMNYLLNKYKQDPSSDYSNYTSNCLITDDERYFPLLSNLFLRGKHPDAAYKQCTPQTQLKFGNILRATNALELSIEICSFASFVNTFKDNASQDDLNDEFFKSLFQLFPKACTFPKLQRRTKNRAFGSSSERVRQSVLPWTCSLKEFGFKGQHRCVVTLLSGPEEPILVSSAHCNYVCKDSKTWQLQEMCCCRNTTEPSSCRKGSSSESSYCTENAELTKAFPRELQIVCGENSLVVQPEAVSEEKEVVLDILEIIIHEGYNPGEPDKERQGPYRGNDIAVYKVNSTGFFYKNGRSKFERKVLYPACLPRERDQYSSSRNLGIFASWNDPEPAWRLNGNVSLKRYAENYYYPRQVVMKEVECKDPEWMKSQTYYPPGTSCYTDPSAASCVMFGNSGAGVMRKVAEVDGTNRYAYTGPLSMSKGCDSAWILEKSITYASKNPSVFTDAYCYLDWIAEKYGMAVPESYVKPQYCSQSKGKIDDIDKSVCFANGHKWGINTENSINHSIYQNSDTLCDFTKFDDEGKPFDRCRLIAQEGFAYNIHQCRDKDNQDVICANNCKGVDPNAVVAGGLAVLAAAAISPLSVLFAPAVGLGTLGTLGGGSYLANGMCPIGSCNVRGRCCMIQLVGSRLQCPSRC